MVTMASGIARGRVLTTAATTTAVESRNMVAILQLIGWQRHAPSVWSVRFWYWTPMLWSINTCENNYPLTNYWTAARLYDKKNRAIQVCYSVMKCTYSNTSDILFILYRPNAITIFCNIIQIFQTPRAGRAFSENSFFKTSQSGRCRPSLRNKAAFSNFSGLVGTWS